MAANVQKQDLVDIELSNGNIHRSWASHAIGLTDNKGDAFGMRVFRDGQPVKLTGISVQGYFRDPRGNNIAITSGNTVDTSGDGNIAYVVLPQACYNYEGQFCLAIKLVGGGITGTMRIVDGMVDNTNTGGAVAPTGTVPTYQEILALYDEMQAAMEGSVRFDIQQELTEEQKQRARDNIGSAQEAVRYDILQELNAIQKTTARENIDAANVNDIAEDFDTTGKGYPAGDYFLSPVDNTLYKSSQAIPASATWGESTTAVEKTDVGTELKAIGAKAKKIDQLDVYFDEPTGKIYITINGIKTGSGAQITVPGDMDVSEIVEWYKSQVQYAYYYIKSLPEGTVSHVMVTDLHYDTNYRNAAVICNLLMDTGKFDKLWILGDITDDNTDAQYGHFIDDGWAEKNGGIIFALGNHDVRTPSGGYPTYQDFYDDFLSNASYASGAASTLYYTYTDEARKIKYVVLNTETITAAANDPQLQMIENAVSESGYGVFVLGHRNLAFGMDLAQELGAAVTEAITNAMESGNADIIGYICGHQHIDVIASIDNSFYLSTWLCDRNETTNYYPGYSVTTRDNGTWSAQAITLISINPENRDIKFMRIGAAKDQGVWEYKYAAHGQSLPAISGCSITIFIDGARSSNRTIFVTSGSSYSTELKADDGSSFGAIVVTMSGTDISETAVDGSTVSIANVTGNVIIKCMSIPYNKELVNFNKVGNGKLDSFNEETGEFTFSTGTRRDFSINALKSGDILHVKYIGSTANGSGYDNADPFKIGYSSGGTNVIYTQRRIDRDVKIPNEGTLLFSAM